MRYLEYKGVKYDVGTVVKMKTKWDGIVTTTFLGNDNYEGICKYSFCSLMPPENYIIEIVKPVYYITPTKQQSKSCSIWTRTGSGSWQSHNDVVIGLIWYIIVMIVGAFFKDCWLIWIGATISFFTWKAHQ